MIKLKTYLFHELSSYLPLLEGEEFDALVARGKELKQWTVQELEELKERYNCAKLKGVNITT
ncbi:hypothetical protein LCGC14_1485100 [marine sediment metagenome]|uniref:Uncharacterized protein n=1 Tax=marine sediment metagenome TaxID=412755 RepID=A0A0F9J921_9ZZZZ